MMYLTIQLTSNNKMELFAELFRTHKPVVCV